MTTTDRLYLAFIAATLLFDHFVLWRTFRRRSPATADRSERGSEGGRARRWLWSAWMTMLWALAGAGLALWWLEGRPWRPLGFVTPHGWRLWVAGLLVLALGTWYGRTIAKIAAIAPARRAGLSGQLGELAAVLPHTCSELALFVALSVSAGFCEELVFRGYLLWVFRPALGLWGAAVLSVVVFAAAHAYQGSKGIVSTGIAGALFTAVVLLFGSLWPAIVLHVLVDAGQGLISWLILREAPGGQEPQEPEKPVRPDAPRTSGGSLSPGASPDRS